MSYNPRRGCADEQRDRESLRSLVRSILAACEPDGRYALGSGNGIPPDVPLENLMILVDGGSGIAVPDRPSGSRAPHAVAASTGVKYTR